MHSNEDPVQPKVNRFLKKYLPNLPRSSKIVIQIPSNRSKRRNVTTDTADIKWITGILKTTYSNKLDNLDERDSFLDRHKLPKLT